MKPKKKSHKLAILFMVVAVAGSIPLGINKSLDDIREDASGAYYYDEGGYAIYEGIELRRGYANDLITLAERYADKDASLDKYIDDLDYQVKRSERAYDEDNTFTNTAAANAAMDAPAQALAGALEQVGLAEKDAKYPAQLIANMRSEQDKIKRSSYNDGARAFNQKLERLKPMAMLHPMATFDAPASGEAQDGNTVKEAVAEETAERSAGLEKSMEELGEAIGEWGNSVGEAAENWAMEIAGQVTEALDG